MRAWSWLWVVVVAGCGMVGPSEEELQCYQACSRDKDACMLAASTAEQIQACDVRSSRCTRTCQ